MAIRNHSYEIFCDSLQEGLWFKRLNDCFSKAELVVIPNSQREQRLYGIEHILQYDRPDIILKDNGNVIFVLERTVEVPSGHNVGQRFGRLVAAAKERIPVVYFGPYMAYKHGGATAGPRYMNLKTPLKDARLIEYLDLFMRYYNANGSFGLTEYIKESDFQAEQYIEQERFAENEVQNPEQYDTPPDSVEIMPVAQFERRYARLPYRDTNIRYIELYHVGMTYIRSDPYAGMAALYHYLYGSDDVVQILHFPNIQFNEWCKLRKTTKTYRMFKEFSYAILFNDQLVMNEEL